MFSNQDKFWWRNGEVVTAGLYRQTHQETSDVSMETQKLRVCRLLSKSCPVKPWKVLKQIFFLVSRLEEKRLKSLVSLLGWCSRGNCAALKGGPAIHRLLHTQRKCVAMNAGRFKFKNSLLFPKGD